MAEVKYHIPGIGGRKKKKDETKKARAMAPLMKGSNETINSMFNNDRNDNSNILGMHNDGKVS